MSVKRNNHILNRSEINNNIKNLFAVQQILSKVYQETSLIEDIQYICDEYRKVKPSELREKRNKDKRIGHRIDDLKIIINKDVDKLNKVQFIKKYNEIKVLIFDRGK